MSSSKEGVIDLVFREADGWVNIDYKTDTGADHYRDELVTHYTPQLTQYARFFRDKLGEPVKELLLFFVKTMETAKVE